MEKTYRSAYSRGVALGALILVSLCQCSKPQASKTTSKSAQESTSAEGVGRRATHVCPDVRAYMEVKSSELRVENHGEKNVSLRIYSKSDKKKQPCIELVPGGEWRTRWKPGQGTAQISNCANTCGFDIKNN